MNARVFLMSLLLACLTSCECFRDQRGPGQYEEHSDGLLRVRGQVQQVRIVALHAAPGDSYSVTMTKELAVMQFRSADPLRRGSAEGIERAMDRAAWDRIVDIVSEHEWGFASHRSVSDGVEWRFECWTEEGVKVMEPWARLSSTAKELVDITSEIMPEAFVLPLPGEEGAIEPWVLELLEEKK